MPNRTPRSMFLVLVLPLDADGTEAVGLTPSLRSDGSHGAEAALSLRVREMSLSTRVKTILSRMGIVTVEDLVQLSAKELMKEQHSGRGTVAEIEKELALLGLHLGMTNEP